MLQESILQCFRPSLCSKRAFCNTFDQHKAIIGLEANFLVFFEWPHKKGFTVFVCFDALCPSQWFFSDLGTFFVNTALAIHCSPTIAGPFDYVWWFLSEFRVSIYLIVLMLYVPVNSFSDIAGHFL